MTRSRRAVLAACGAGLTSLAGCARIELSGEDAPTFDAARLVDLGETDVPRPPATFPVSVPDAMVSRHRDRARELVERVPDNPDVPNGTVVERLQQDRDAVLERLDGGGDGNDTGGSGSDPLGRLREARSVRRDAAAVEAAYRAATDDVTPQAVDDRRARLRSALLSFEGDWTYRGDDPASAVVVHRALEALLGDVRPALAPERAFPGTPTADVFGVGEIVGDLEGGRAALTDAEGLRTRHREGLSDPRPYRTDVSVAAGRVWRLHRQYERDLDDHLDPSVEALPFDRSIEGTAVETAYRRAAYGAWIFGTDAEEARERGDRATAAVATGRSLAHLRALDAVVADVRDDRITGPETADELAAARREAIDSLERAWSTAPAVLATEVAHWSWVLVEEARDHLRGTGYEADYTPDSNDAHQAFANYATAARVAAAVPQTVADLQAALGSARSE